MRRLWLALVLGCGGPAEPTPVGPEPVENDLDVDPRPTEAPPPAAPSLPAAAPAAAPERDEVAQGPPRRRAKIDLDLVDADLHNVFRLLADAGDVNIVVADDVKGRITIQLRSVPWHQAFDAIVKTEKLVAEYQDGLILVRRRDKVR